MYLKKLLADFPSWRVSWVKLWFLQRTVGLDFQENIDGLWDLSVNISIDTKFMSVLCLFFIASLVQRILN
jgi:hypothetical protein